MTEVMASTQSRYAADDRVERVVVFNDHSSRNGGAAILALLLIQKLRERGLAVRFVTGDAGDNPELADLGVDVIAYGGSDLLSRSKGRPLPGDCMTLRRRSLSPGPFPGWMGRERSITCITGPRSFRRRSFGP